MARLVGRRAAVIGAGSVGPGWGNGKAAAVLFAREGAQVLCVDRYADAAEQTARIIRDEGGIAEPWVADVTDEDDAAGVVAEMDRLWGGTDILHFNVGGNRKGGATDQTVQDWNAMLALNLTSAMLLTRAVLPGMRDRGRGVLTYVSSLAAIRSGPYAYLSYETAKAGLCRMARSVARENAPHGIRANSILPGMIDTPHVSAFIAGDTDARELARARAAQVPMGRQGTAWDVAHAGLFLASDEASFVTGTELVVDGGMSA